MNSFPTERAATFAFKPPQECERPYTVSQINDGIAAILESGNTLVWFTGEISGYKRHSSGHSYFRVKDALSQIPAVMWSSAVSRLRFAPEDGMAVNGVASIRVYRKGGYYQLDVRRMQPAGLGELYAAFEALKKKLEQEGLFDEARKKPLPRSVTRLGVVTARTGAAIQDIIRVVSSRAPGTDIYLYSVRVQGEGAAKEIAHAIRRFNEHGQVDCLIVGRGGGSIEDLWAFNEEIVARAIAASAIPVISAVGHETDFTIADFVADVRAPTPSAAAEMAVADEEENRRFFAALARQFATGYIRFFADARERLGQATRGPGLRDAVRRVVDGRQALDEIVQRASRQIAQQLRERTAALAAQSGRLQALSPLAVLGRGYSVVTRTDGALVRDSRAIAPGETVRMRFARGGAEAEVREVEAE